MTEHRQLVAPGLGWLVVLLVAWWAYAPGLHGPALLDDTVNLSRLEKLGEQPEFAADVASGNKSGALGRSVSMWSFTLEKLYLDDGLYGIKRTNLVIHLVNGSLVLWLFSALLSYARLPAARWLAVFFAAAWLLSPLFVSTVLYSVQRMAQLSTLGILAALLAYSLWRLDYIQGVFSWGKLSLVLASLVFAVLAKENGALAVPLLLLLEGLWFRFEAPSEAGGRRFRRLFWLACGAVTVVGLAGLAYLWKGLAASYAARDFTLGERLLTQGRALWDYLAQLVWPQTYRMGLFHDDYPVSTALTAPPTTLAALLGWMLLAAGCLAAIRYRSGRLVACGLGFYLLGHAMESTILPLELYFEHRAYAPGVGLFLALAVLTGLLLRRCPDLRGVLCSAGCIALAGLAVSAGSQAALWSSRELITLSSLNAHPASLRANVEMAALLAERGEIHAALSYSERAARLQANPDDVSYQVRDLALVCLANKPLPQGMLAGLAINPQQAQLRNLNSNMGTLARLLQDDYCPAFDTRALADRLAEIFLQPPAARNATRNLFTLMAQLESHLGRYEVARTYTSLLLEKSPDDIRGLQMQMYFSAALGDEESMAAIRARLIEMEQAGLLSREEQHNLALFK